MGIRQWWETYVKQRWVESDPVVLAAEQRATGTSWEPGEPVQSILRVYKANPRRFKYSMESGSGCAARFLLDNVTQVKFEVLSYYDGTHSNLRETGLNLQETIWLLQQVGKYRSERAARASYLRGKRNRAQLHRLYCE